MNSQLDRIEERQAEHEKLDAVRFGKIEETLDKIQNNHLAHIQTDMALVKNDLRWIRNISYVIITFILGILAFAARGVIQL